MYSKYYKALYRRVNRLPLDERSIRHAKQNLRLQFTQSKVAPTHSVVNRKLYDRAINVFDSILVDEKYKDFDKLLSLVYQDLRSQPAWVTDFHHTRYGAFKKTWPQVHLIDEFGDARSRRKYHDALSEMQPVTRFSFSEALNIPKDTDLGSLTPLKRSNSKKLVSKEQELLDEVIPFHGFLKANAKVLSDTQIHMLEVCYKTSRYGLPPSIATMEAELKKKVNYAKFLLNSFKPIGLADLLYLIEYVTSNPGPQPSINPIFFQYMLRKRNKERGKLSPAIQKYVRHKQLIPNERNILHCYRQYIVRQFYVDKDGQYSLSPMQNIYE